MAPPPRHGAGLHEPPGAHGGEGEDEAEQAVRQVAEPVRLRGRGYGGMPRRRSRFWCVRVDRLAMSARHCGPVVVVIVGVATSLALFIFFRVRIIEGGRAQIQVKINRVMILSVGVKLGSSCKRAATLPP
jgi:hypothetical protein